MNQDDYLPNLTPVYELEECYEVYSNKHFVMGSSFLEKDTEEYKNKVKSTINLMCAAPDLLQIAEMYYDYLKSSGQTQSIPFEVTEQVLKKIGTR